jgi:hypothetical protein
MKAMAMPVELLIVMIVGVVVLLALILFYYGGWRGSETITIEVALGRACAVVTANMCNEEIYYDPSHTVSGVDLNKDGVDDSVSSICTRAGLTDINACYRRCTCSGY